MPIESSPAQSRARLLLAAYFLSGVAGLVYEVLWQRQISFVVGHSAGATSAVLAVFLGGLAAGAVSMARLASGLTAPAALRTYAAIEAGVAIWAVALPYLAAALPPLLAVAYRDGEPGAGFALLRFASLAAPLLPATLALGATFPLIVRSARSLSVSPATLYALNTTGAAAGAWLAGFVLIPSGGLLMTTMCGAGLSVAAAALALLARRGAWPGESLQAAPAATAAARRKPRRSPSPPSAAAPPSFVVLTSLVAISGAATLAYEVVWTRLIALAIGPTIQAFSLMLALFIGGLGIGAWLGERIGSRVQAVQSWLLLATMASGTLATFVAARLASTLPVRVGALVASRTHDYTSLLVSEGLAISALLLPATILFGMTFPLALSAAASVDRRTERVAGILYAISTLGAIAGALVAGYVLMPAIGATRTLTALGAFVSTAVLATAWMIGGSARPKLAITALAAVGLWFAWAGSTLDPSLFASGAYKYASTMTAGDDLASQLEAGDLLFYKDGAGATVTVRRLAGVTSLAIDGKVDASNGGDMLTQQLLAHLPLLLHPAPRLVTILGLGSGVTAGAALAHDVVRVDAIELSRDVVAAARFFDRDNNGALDDPRTRVIVGDGRTHLALTNDRSDVIISEPSNPWMAGIASLYTREFFAIARDRLAEGGVMCQWAHTYDISREDLRSIVATFTSVFPETTLWLVGESDVLLIGSLTPLPPRLVGLPMRLAERRKVRADLARISADSAFALLSLNAGDTAAARAYGDGAIVQTDDRTPLEFSAPRALYARSPEPHVKELTALAERVGRPSAVSLALERVTAADWRARGAMLQRAEASRLAYDAFDRALALDPASLEAVTGLIDSAAAQGQGETLRPRLEAAAASGAAAPALGLARLAAAQGDFATAEQLARGVVATRPESAEAWEQLASTYADAGAVEPLADIVGLLETKFATRPLTPYFAASLAFSRGEMPSAIRLGRDALRRDPTNARAANLVGAALASSGDTAGARAAFVEAINLSPSDPIVLVNAARLEASSGNPEGARRRYAEALVVAPASLEAREGLADALDRLGASGRAALVRSSRPPSS